jgi:O-antigen biosynthesis protein
MNPKVSLIMSVYNGASHLEESIESILRQTYTDFECVIIDDASTDRTPNILAAYAHKDPRMKLLRNESNLGLTASLNKAIRASVGEYIARMDAGDTSEPTRFEKQVLFLNEHPDHCLVGSWATSIDDAGNGIGAMEHPTDDKTLRSVLIRYHPFVHSSLMIRRNALDAVGLFDERWKYAQDYDLVFRLLTQGKIANIGERLVSYRFYPNSITARKNRKQVLYAMKARIQAIRRGQYPVWSYIWLYRPIVGFIISHRGKQFLKRFVS